MRSPRSSSMPPTYRGPSLISTKAWPTLRQDEPFLPIRSTPSCATASAPSATDAAAPHRLFRNGACRHHCHRRREPRGCRQAYGKSARFNGNFASARSPFVDFAHPARIIRAVQTRSAEETGLVVKIGRRRRSNRPGTSQAKGPQIDGTLESSRLNGRLTEGVRRAASRRNLSGPATEGA